jgi:hypothetical protein
LISILTHSDYVFAGQEKNLLRPFEFFQVPYVLAVNPDSGVS